PRRPGPDPALAQDASRGERSDHALNCFLPLAAVRVDSRANLGVDLEKQRGEPFRRSWGANARLKGSRSIVPGARSGRKVNHHGYEPGLGTATARVFVHLAPDEHQSPAEEPPQHRTPGTGDPRAVPLELGNRTFITVPREGPRARQSPNFSRGF